MSIPKTRREIERALEEAREALAEKVQEHRRAVLKDKVAGKFEQEVAELRARIEELNQAIGDTTPEQPIEEPPTEPPTQPPTPEQH